MIPDLWYAFWITVIDGVMDWLPAWSFSTVSPVNATPTGPTTVQNGITHTVDLLRLYDMLIPLEEMLVCVGFLMLLAAAMIGYYAVMWIIKRLTFSG